MRAQIGAGVLILTVGACSSFGSSPSGEASDAGGTTDATALDAAAVDAQGPFCPPKSSDVTCWDFDDGVPVGGTTKAGGTLNLDDKVFASPSFSLRATTPVVEKGGTQLWAFVSDVRTLVMHVSVELKLRLDKPFDYAELVELRIGESVPTRHQIVLIGDGPGTLLLQEGTFVNNSQSQGSYKEYPLGPVAEDNWVHVSIDLTLKNFPGPSAERHLLVKVDGVPKVEDDAARDLKSINATQTIVAAGITMVNPSSSSKAGQSVHIDDVLVRWGP